MAWKRCSTASSQVLLPSDSLSFFMILREPTLRGSVGASFDVLLRPDPMVKDSNTSRVEQDGYGCLFCLVDLNYAKINHPASCPRSIANRRTSIQCRNGFGILIGSGMDVLDRQRMAVEQCECFRCRLNNNANIFRSLFLAGPEINAQRQDS